MVRVIKNSLVRNNLTEAARKVPGVPERAKEIFFRRQPYLLRSNCLHTILSNIGYTGDELTFRIRKQNTNHKG